MLIIGLTGGIGSGKSTVAGYFESLGVPVIDADKITRELVEPGQEALGEIINTFGDSIIQADGRLNRSRLREHIFKNPDERKKLENILHPRARKIVQQQINELSTPYCILSVPLLIESGWVDLVQRILVVDSPRDLQIKRTIERDKVSKEQVESIIASQTDRKTRLAAADDILENTDDRATLREKIVTLHKKYTLLGQSMTTS